MDTVPVGEKRYLPTFHILNLLHILGGSFLICSSQYYNPKVIVPPVFANYPVCPHVVMPLVVLFPCGRSLPMFAQTLRRGPGLIYYPKIESRQAKEIP